MVRACMVLACLVAFGAITSAQEWTRFRGPNGSGQSEAKGIPAVWTDKDYNWRVKLPGLGHASPVLWGKRLFVTSADAKEATQHVLCLDAQTGRTLWQRQFECKPHHLHQFNSFASSTPAVDEERMYVAWSSPDELVLMALDHEGKDVWRRSLGPFVSQHGFGTSPIVHEDLVILPNDQGDQDGHGQSFLLAVDRRTGEDRWRIPRRTREVAYATPCVHQVDGGKPELIFSSGAHGLTAVDPASGKINWEIDVLEMRSCSSPIIVGGLIFTSCGNGQGRSNYVVTVRPPKGASPPEEVDRPVIGFSATYVPGFVAKDHLVFVWSDRGIATCFDARASQVVWQERVGGNFFGSPIRVADKIYCIDTAGTVSVIRASDKYELLAKVSLGEPSNSTPAVADGVMYLRTESHLMSLGGK